MENSFMFHVKQTVLNTHKEWLNSYFIKLLENGNLRIAPVDHFASKILSIVTA